MAVPSPDFRPTWSAGIVSTHISEEKSAIRRSIRNTRRSFVEGLDPAVRNLAFRRPPGPVAALCNPHDTIGFYVATPDEAPTRHLLEFFHENGKTVALPRFEDRAAPMRFRSWSPHIELEVGPWRVKQPNANADMAKPGALFIPMLAYDEAGHRLGQGGGHYDSYLAEHPDIVKIGMAWSVQHIDSVPVEPHDQSMDAILTQSSYLLASKAAA